jgi:general stress protein YciG
MTNRQTGGQKTAATNKARYGADFYVRLGEKGGKSYNRASSPPKGFAADRERARRAGKIGGTRSRRKTQARQNMITALTQAQQAKIPDFIEKWVNMAAKPTDRKQAAKAVQAMYAAMGEARPTVVFGDSPLATAYMAAMFFEAAKNGQVKKAKLGRQLSDQPRGQPVGQLSGRLQGQLYAQLSGRLYDQLRSQLDGQPRSQLDGRLADQLADRLADPLRAQLLQQLDSQLNGQLRDRLRGQLRDQLGDQLDDRLAGQLGDEPRDIDPNWYIAIFWLSWAGLYDFAKYIGVKFDQKTYDLFMSFVPNVSFIIPYKGIAFVSETPNRIVWDASGRLSYDHGKAVRYKDGYGLYCLDGVTFSEEEYNKIVNEEFTLETIAAAKMGADKSAVAQKYLRPDRLLEACKAKLVHTGQKGTELYQVDNFMDTGRTQYCMKMKHPSIDRHYIEWVHPDIGKQGNADLAQCAAWRDEDGHPITLANYLLAVEA